MKALTIFGGLLLLAAVAAGYLMMTETSQVKGVQVREIRWLLSHQPTDVFERAADVFKTELEKGSNGTMTLKVMTPEDAGVAKGDIPNAEVLRILKDGEADIATAYTVGLGSLTPDMWAVNLPFLFSDAEAVSRALDGEAGSAIMASLSERSNLVGLAFTMSGGYRIIASKNTAITSAADLKGKRIATSGGPVAEATLKALGAVPVSTDLESGNASIDASTIDGVEITYSRLGQVIGNSQYTKYVNETNHSVFLTAILADKAFFSSLSTEEQSVITKAALAAAQVERQDSLALGNSVRDELKKTGSTVSVLSQDAAAEFAAKSRSVYAEFIPQFSAGVAAAVGGAQ